MTFEEAKKQVAKKYGYPDWESIDWYQVDYSFHLSETKGHAQDLLNTESAELYANSKAAEAYNQGIHDYELVNDINISYYDKPTNPYKP